MDGKNYSGADSITPALGFETIFDKSLFGIRLQYAFIEGKRQIIENQSEREVDYAVKGGELFKAELFYELDQSPRVYGVSLTTYSHSRSTKTAVSPYANDTSLAALNAKLIPKIGYQWAQAFDKTSLSSASGWQLELAGRLTF